MAFDPDTDEGRKALLVDFLVKMHIEQNTNVRHLETQRSTATNIFAVIATAVLVIIGQRWQPGIGPTRSDLPLTFGLIGLSIAGALLAMKLFERSRINHDLSEAYRETAEDLLSKDMRECIADRTSSLPYVRSVLRFIDTPGERKPYEVRFVQNTKTYRFISPDEYRGIIRDNNPIDPRAVIIPRHNARAKWLTIPWVVIDTHKSWLAVHMAYGIIGVILTAIALIP